MATIEEQQKEIIELYIATFNRAPDYDGLSYWLEKITEDQWSIDDIALSFFDQEETQSKYPTELDNEEFLNEIYNNVLGRDPDQEGVNYWLEELDNGTLLKSDMIIAIINGAKADTGTQEDKQYLENKTEAGYYYAVELELNDLDIAKTAMQLVDTTVDSIQNSKDLQDFFKSNESSLYEIIVGDEDANNIEGTSNNNFIYGGEGNDTIITSSGDNMILSGSGTDTIHTGDGIDTVKAGLGDDTIYSYGGNDILYGNAGDDSLHGLEGNDTIYGESGDDYIYGDEGDDTLYGGDDDDSIYGGEGDDIIYAGNGNDAIFVTNGENFIDASFGDDIINGGSDIDTVYGGEGNDTIYGQEGDDILEGLLGDDLIYGGPGSDIINGSEGDDELYCGSGEDVINAEEGDDIIYAGLGVDLLAGGEGDDNFIFDTLTSTMTEMDTIIDFTYNGSGADTISLVNKGIEIISTTKLNIAGITSLNDAVDFAVSGDGSTNALVNWFIFEDNTYIVEDVSAENTFQEASDLVIKLQGNIDLLGLDTHTISFL